MTRVMVVNGPDFTRELSVDLEDDQQLSDKIVERLQAFVRHDYYRKRWDAERMMCVELQEQSYLDDLHASHEQLACPICTKLPKDPTFSNVCEHMHCYSCMEEWTCKNAVPTCPMCRKAYTKLFHQIRSLTTYTVDAIEIIPPLESTLDNCTLATVASATPCHPRMRTSS